MLSEPISLSFINQKIIFSSIHSHSIIITYCAWMISSNFLDWCMCCFAFRSSFIDAKQALQPIERWLGSSEGKTKKNTDQRTATIRLQNRKKGKRKGNIHFVMRRRDVNNTGLTMHQETTIERYEIKKNNIIKRKEGHKHKVIRYYLIAKFLPKNCAKSCWIYCLFNSMFHMRALQ